jgi:hypothetical protein
MNFKHVIYFSLAFFFFSAQTIADDNASKSGLEQKEKNQDCQAPQWAIAIGHEDKWKLHNGCSGKKDNVKNND